MQELQTQSRIAAAESIVPAQREWYPNTEGARAPRVHVFNGVRHVMVTIDASDVPIDDVRIEGRGDRMLLIWRQSRIAKVESATAFGWADSKGIFARSLELPADVRYDSAEVSLEGRRLCLRFPRKRLGPYDLSAFRACQ